VLAEPQGPAFQRQPLTKVPVLLEAEGKIGRGNVFLARSGCLERRLEGGEKSV